MRHDEYKNEKKTYKTPEYILKNDKKYRKKQPEKFRFHLFVQLTVLSVQNNIALVIYEKKHQYITLQNMDSFFYLNEYKKVKIEKQIQLLHP